MGQSTKRTLFAIMVVVLLLPACAPAPAATQDPAIIQQLIEQSVEKAFTTQNAQASQQALTVALQSTQTATQPAAIAPTDTPQPTATEESAFVPGDPATDTPAPTSTDIPVTPGASRRCSTRNESRLAAQGKAKILLPVNFRTAPGLLKHITRILEPNTQVDVLRGPIIHKLGYQRYYYWWQIKLPDGSIGWSVELSLCGDYYFMEPAS